MAVYVVGDFLRETRLRKGYTQEEVSYGICTPASLSRIENGAQKPGRLILEKLFERLGTENNLFNSFVSREVKCTLCQGHYDFSFSDFYFIFVCCVEASK